MPSPKSVAVSILTSPIFMTLATIAVVLANASQANGDIVHDFAATPITWNTSLGSLTWDSDGDLIHDFRVSVVSGFIDTTSGLFVIDNNSTSAAGIEKTFIFSIESIDPSLPNSEVQLLGFDVFTEKNIEVGGSGGAGSIGADVFDDGGAEMVNGVNISGSLGSNPSSIVLPGSSQSKSFKLTVDLDSPPNNDDAQVIIGNIVFNGGTIRSFSSAVPEPCSGLLIGLGCLWFGVRRRARN